MSPSDKGFQPSTAVAILPTSIIPPPSSPSSKTTLTPLTFPSSITDASALVPLYIARKDSHLMLVEILRFSSSHGSWFLVPDALSQPPTMCSNGNITMVTPVDPLFPILLLLDAHRDVGDKQLFQPLDSMCAAADGTNLAQFSNPQQLAMLCDVKHAADIAFYRLCDDKAIAWLDRKFQALKHQPNVTPTDAIDILSQYITPKWAQRLRNHVFGDTVNQDNQISTAETNGPNLALQTMLEQATANNNPFPQPNGKKSTSATSKQASATTAPTKTKVVKRVPASSWWAKREKTLTRSGSTKSSQKRTRSSTK